MKAAVEIVTPHMAKEMLERMPINRPLSRKTIDRYSRDMIDGRWNNNGQGIVLSEDGTLLDGQHRLKAIIQSQCTVSMLVVRGAEKSTFITMDSGKPRALSDVLAMQGHEYTTKMAAIARAAYAYVCGAIYPYTATKPTLEAFIKRHPYVAEVAKIVGQRKHLCPNAALGAVLFIANENGLLAAEVESFVEGIIYGEGLYKGDARHTLREWLVGQRDTSRGPPSNLKSESVFAAVARSWNAYAAGNQITALRALVRPTRDSLKIMGFDRMLYPDVPDITERVAEIRRSNLSEGRRREVLLQNAIVESPPPPPITLRHRKRGSFTCMMF